MSHEPNGPVFGVGAYTALEAAKLLEMDVTTLRRWLKGYRYRRGGSVHEQKRLWKPSYSEDEDGVLLGFRDLVEARIVNALRRSHIGLPTIRLCIDRAVEMLGSDHPFSTSDFKHDGKRLFLEITEGMGEPVLIDLKRRQHVFRSFVLPSLSGLEFGDQKVERWWLDSRHKTLLIDPKRSFGQPILADVGVLATRIAQDVRAEGSIDRVAKLYGASRRAVSDAVAFEARTLH